ncbi:MAG: serine/threonine-protein kinase, partial [Planctomycetota bacterium]
VAIKLLARVDDRLRDRFAFERQALARLDHPDVARVLDAGDHDGRAFLVVELAPGRPITEFCEAEQLDADERIALFARVCDAVAHAHARGLLHCDLKPSNVLVWRDTNEHDIRLKVIDFGIARLLGADDAEGVVGTPAYMSPEQAGNGAIDVRSDVYALGLLLHALLGGANPVAAETKSKSRRALVQTAAAAPRPEPLQGNVPREADWIIERATEPEPDARYETVARLGDDVKRVLDRRPVAAGPATLSYYVQRHAARNKPLAAAIAVAALILLGGIGATAYQAIRATNAERQALEDRDAAEATSRFLQRVLFSARPDFRNPEAAAAFVEAVDRARDGLATDLRGNPEVRSELLDMIGMIYFESNRYAEARPLLEEAYTLRRGLFGPDDARTLRSHEQFAGVLRYLREHDQAIEHASEVVRRGETVGLPRDEVILRNARLTLSESRLRRRAPGDLEGMRELALDARRRMEATSPRSVAARENLSRLMLNYADGILEFANEQNPELRQEFPEFLTLGYELIADIPMGTSRSMLQLNHL